jgi:hypothetical protein
MLEMNIDHLQQQGHGKAVWEAVLVPVAVNGQCSFPTGSGADAVDDDVHVMSCMCSRQSGPFAPKVQESISITGVQVGLAASWLRSSSWVQRLGVLMQWMMT